MVAIVASPELDRLVSELQAKYVRVEEALAALKAFDESQKNVVHCTPNGAKHARRPYFSAYIRSMDGIGDLVGDILIAYAEAGGR